MPVCLISKQGVHESNELKEAVKSCLGKNGIEIPELNETESGTIIAAYLNGDQSRVLIEDRFKVSACPQQATA